MRYLLCFACVVFAACGGPGEAPGGGNQNVVAGMPSGTSDCNGTWPATGSYRLGIRTVDEVEPNDVISTAYPVSMPTAAAPEDLVGLVIEGSVHDKLDRSDVFAFTSSRTRRMVFKLCASSCNTRDYYDTNGNPDSLPVWFAYFSVLDADGEVLESTEFHIPIDNFGELCIPAGVITYIAVYANDTLNLVQPYQVSAVEIGF